MAQNHRRRLTTNSGVVYAFTNGETLSAESTTQELDPQPESFEFPTTGYDADLYAFQPTLASPLSRLGAVLVDSILAFIVLVGGSLLGRFADELAFNGPTLVSSLVPLGAVLVLAWTQLSMLTRSGQTVGKSVVGISVAADNGEPPGFARNVLLRMLLPACLFAIPFLGQVIALIDGLMVFTAGRQTLRDRFAKTHVHVGTHPRSR